MIFDYGFSVRGKSHLQTGTCCQDSHMIKQLENGWFVAAVADGVGSAKNSHIGSKIAAETAVNFCCEYMPWDYNLISIKSMLRTAYNYAYKQILRESERQKQPIESYDTTLTLAIYDGNRIIYGHSGDGAIIGLNTFGEFVEITRVQKGEDGISVIPLRGGYTNWAIDSYEEDLCAVLLMTDGVLDTLCPYLLNDVETGQSKVYVPLGTYFASPKAIGEHEAVHKNLRREMERFLTAEENYDGERFYKRLNEIYKAHVGDKANALTDNLKKLDYCNLLMQKQQDDKTIVGLVNTKAVLDDKPPEFFAEPNWEALQEAWNRKAYPHLYKEEAEKGEQPQAVGGANMQSSATTVSGVGGAKEASETNVKAGVNLPFSSANITNTTQNNSTDNKPQTATAQPKIVKTSVYKEEELNVPEFMDMKVKTISQIEQYIKVQNGEEKVTQQHTSNGQYSLDKKELDEINRIINSDIETKTKEEPVAKKKTFMEKLGDFFE